jgi:ATP-binding cassette subfamily B protein/subfamily B ATP-binding cassette protein MsbA
MKKQTRSSRHRYRSFVEDYKRRTLEDSDGTKDRKAQGPKDREAEGDARPDGPKDKGKRREYLREYLRWLWPHRFAVGGVFLFALMVASLQMIEPLFMRFIIDRVLLNTALDRAARLRWLNLAGGAFLLAILLNNLLGALRDYRQRLLNVKVMLSLRRSLFERMLRLPLAKLWEMKTGGILSRLTGDIDTTTGLLQLAVISPSISVIRLLIAIVVLISLNWRLALMALAVIPGAMFMSFIFARRVRPIYRAVRKDVEGIDGRVGEAFSGIPRGPGVRTGRYAELLDYERRRGAAQETSRSAESSCCGRPGACWWPASTSSSCGTEAI